MSPPNKSSLSQLPQPSADAIAHSLSLQKLIIDEINKAGDQLTFAEYMRLALYAPGLGYYSAGAQKLGAGGDFVTAPEISALFGMALAKQCQQILISGAGNTLFELGAGSGKLAATLLLELEQLQCLPDHYLILEISADLRERQRAMILEKCPHILSRIQWLDGWPAQPIKGVIIANEVLDAMPVHRLYFNADEIKEYYVTHQNDCFNWSLQTASSEELLQAAQKIQQHYLFHAQHYSTEINLLMPSWINRLSQCLDQGVILLIDYGYPRAEYYLADRCTGTMMCYYRHRVHDDPFFWPGLQDITTHVDFTGVAEAAVNAGLSVAGYNSQAGFLLGCGIMDCYQQMHESVDAIAQFNLQQQLKQLTLPVEMGEIIKVLALSRGVDISLRGFSLQDRRGGL